MNFIVKGVLFLLLSLAVGAPAADIIPANRVGLWGASYQGVPGGIPTTWTNWCDVTVNIPGTNILAVADGVSNCVPALTAALRLCPSNSVVYLPAGTYLLSTNLGLGNNSSVAPTFPTLHNKIMRGAGSNQTVLQLNFTNTTASGVLVGGFSWSGTVRSNFADLRVGQTNLNGMTNLTGVTAGTLIFLQENDASSNNVFSPGPLDGSADPVHYMATHNTKSRASAPLVRQGFVVQSVSGSNVVVWPPSNFNFHSNYSRVQVAQTFSCRNFGIENLSIKNMAGGLGTNINKIVEVNQAAYFWMKGVRTENAAFAHVHPSYTVGTTITESTFSGAPVVGPSAGVGIHFASHNNNALVYNNVFDNSYPAIEYYLGSSGMATMYNAAVNARGGLPAFDFHNAHHELNLFEGNVANGIIQDGYFGSAAWITLHRNWFHASPSDGGFRRAIDICRFGREWNIVNNVLGNPTNTPAVYDGTFTNGWTGGLSAIYRLGHPEMGATTWTGTNTTKYATNTAALDLWVTTNLIRHLNYDFVTQSVTNHDANITNTTSPVSYFADWNSYTKPTWYTNAAWPPIGSELTVKTNGNPAYNWYYNISYSVSGGDTNTYPYIDTNIYTFPIIIPQFVPAAPVKASSLLSPLPLKFSENPLNDPLLLQPN